MNVLPAWRKPFRVLQDSKAIFLLFLVMPALAHAQAGGASPFDTGFSAMQNLFTGTVAKVASLIAIVVGGYQFAHGEPGAKKITGAAGDKPDSSRTSPPAGNWPKSSTGQSEGALSDGQQLSTRIQLRDAPTNECRDSMGFSLLKCLEASDGLFDSDQERM
jgi:type IV secretion system protein VirB2